MGTRKNSRAEAVLTCTHNVCLQQKSKENLCFVFSMKFSSFFLKKKNLFRLHSHVFVMWKKKKSNWQLIGTDMLHVHVSIRFRQENVTKPASLTSYMYMYA